MEVATTVDAARDAIAKLPRPLALVPTMGALHAGHLRLVDAAREAAPSVVASVFVNPLQFGPSEDFERYPRDFEADHAHLAERGVSLVFAPEVTEMYPAGFATLIEVAGIGAAFEGAKRPTHFRGVTTVVGKLLNIVRPDVLFLGQKDAQQTAVIRRMVRDLAFPVRVEIVPTVREPDGLAMSSRNVYLSSDERAAAPTLYAALQRMRDEMAQGANAESARESAKSVVSPIGTLEYLDAVDAETFEPLERLRAPAFVVGALRFGTTRLLDNIWVRE